jgi:hypothetical protein
MAGKLPWCFSPSEEHMPNPDKLEGSEKLDNLLTDQKISFQRARELLDSLVSLSQLEKQILQELTSGYGKLTRQPKA